MQISIFQFSAIPHLGAISPLVSQVIKLKKGLIHFVDVSFVKRYANWYETNLQLASNLVKCTRCWAFLGHFLYCLTVCYAKFLNMYILPTWCPPVELLVCWAQQFFLLAIGSYKKIKGALRGILLVRKYIRLSLV